MASDPLFGWDLTFTTVEKNLKRKSDVLIAFIHWNLTKRGFRIIEIEDEQALTGKEERSELLPNGWNDNDTYKLRYVFDDKLYILHGLNTGGNLIINLLRSEDLAVSNLALDIEGSVQAMTGKIDKLIPGYKDIMFNINRDLIDTVTQAPASSVQTQTTEELFGRRIDSAMFERREPSANDRRDLWEIPPVGRSDLDPFAPGGGGMFVNPFERRRDIENPGFGIPGGLPRGAVPPGARFDPFAPPGVGPMPGRRPPPPDADHLPPPFNGNMFSY